MALEKSGLLLTMESYDSYMKKLDLIDKAHRQAFNPNNFNEYEKAAKRAAAAAKAIADQLKNMPKAMPKMPSAGGGGKGGGGPLLPPPDDAKRLQEALDLLGQSGKFAIAKISEETLKLNAALALAKKSAQFDIKAIQPIKSNILGDLTKSLDESIAKGHGLKSVFGDLSGFLGGQFTKTIFSVGAILTSVFAVSSIKNFISGLGDAAVAANAQFENFQLQFTTLLKSQDKAQAKIQELAKFAEVTPYELPEIVEATRLLQTFGGVALTTQENLTLIGDSAAAVNAPFKEVAFWTGRMYSSMQSGRPFGEASMRMQELGIMSGETRNKLEEMQKAGASGSELWKVYSEAIGDKFAGAMVRLSRTFGGIMSTLSDFQSMLVRVGGQDYFEVIRDSLLRFYDNIARPEVTEALTALATSIGAIGAAVTENLLDPLLTGLESIEPESITNLADSIGDIATASRELTGLDFGNFDTYVDALAGMAQSTATIMQLINQFNSLREAMGPIGVVGTKIKDVFTTILFPVIGLTNNVLGLGGAFNDLNSKLRELTGYSISEVVAGAGMSGEEAQSWQDLYNEINNTTEATEKGAYEQENYGDAIYDTTAIIERQTEALKEQITVLEATQNAFKQAGNIKKNYDKAVAEAGEDYAKEYAEKEAQYTEDRAKMVKDQAKALADFDKENAKKRQDMIDEFNINQANAEKQFNLQRAQAQAQYNQTAAQESKKFQLAQQQELKRHQLAMLQAERQQSINDRRLRADGDVLALMEAREDYANQQQTNQENFDLAKQQSSEQFTQQQQMAADSFKLQEAQAQESFRMQTDMQREEFQRRLEDFDANLIEQRDKLVASHIEELALLDAKWEEEKVRLYEQYQERLAMAEEQKNEQLEALGAAMQEEGAVTEEGMKEIAAKIAELFGEEAAGDALINGWSERTQDAIAQTVDEVGKQIDELKEKLKSLEDGAAAATSSPGAPAGFGPNPSTISNPPSGASANPIGARYGFNGIVTGPKTFKVEPGVTEHVAFTPMSKLGGNLNVSGRMGVDVTGLSAGATPELENKVVETLVDGIKAAVRQLTRRRG